MMRNRVRKKISERYLNSSCPLATYILLTPTDIDPNPLMYSMIFFVFVARE